MRETSIRDILQDARSACDDTRQLLSTMKRGLKTDERLVMTTRAIVRHTTELIEDANARRDAPGGRITP